jgi:heat shock protein HslJ
MGPTPPGVRIKLTLLALIAGALAAGHASAGSDPLDGWWRVASVDHVAVPFNSPRGPYLVLHDGEFSGSDGCSGFWGRYSWSSARLKIMDGATTGDFCASPSDPNLMQRAHRLQSLVMRADSFRRTRATLVLGDHGAETLELTRAPDTDRIREVGDPSHRMTILSDPQWTRRPSPDQIAKAKSDPAVGGDRQFQLLCAISADGAPTSCELLYPDRPQTGSNGLRNALDLTEAYRLSPHDIGLVRRSHASIILDINL